MTTERERALQHLARAIKVAESYCDVETKPAKKQSIQAHLDHALDVCDLDPWGFQAEPVRTLHHFSCTGGTLITKCVASMANVLVLNEVDLHSNIPTQTNSPAVFAPTDMISLLRQGDTNISPDLISKVFLADLEVLREEQWKIGKKVVLRDHSHSHFLMGSNVSEAPTLLEIVKSKLPTRSVVTVRHPFDSYASMEAQGWHEMFTPSSFEEYCRRYNSFLDAYEHVPIVKYEDFTARPKGTMRHLCRLLDLTYNSSFDQVFSVFRFSGDSGRSSDVIKRRPIRKTARRTGGCDLTSSQEWLLNRLGYEH